MCCKHGLLRLGLDQLLSWRNSMLTGHGCPCRSPMDSPCKKCRGVVEWRPRGPARGRGAHEAEGDQGRKEPPVNGVKKAVPGAQAPSHRYRESGRCPASK